jgi:hypothetical protein
MSSPSATGRFKRHAVPLAVASVVTIAVLVVPPIVLGEVTTRTYALTAAVLIIAVSAVFPYAVLVALGTLPLLYAGVASFAAPRTAADDIPPFSAVTALRHGVAGLSYVLGAAAVGAIGIGVQMAVESDPAAIPAAAQPLFLYLGGVVVAGTFVCLQLWRYDTPLDALPRRTVLGTVALGVLLALSPAVAFWVFNSTIS